MASGFACSVASLSRSPDFNCQAATTYMVGALQTTSLNGGGPSTCTARCLWTHNTSSPNNQERVPDTAFFVTNTAKICRENEGGGGCHFHMSSPTPSTQSPPSLCEVRLLVCCLRHRVYFPDTGLQLDFHSPCKASGFPGTREVVPTPCAI